MKLRNGFVSNSSSSSFILKLKYIPESLQDMENLFQIPECYNSSMLYESLFERIKDFFNSHNEEKQKKILKDRIYDGLMRDAYTYNYSIFYIEDHDIRKLELKNLEERLKKEAEVKYDKLMTDGNTYCIVTYRDGDGEFESFMEHSGIFDEIVERKISNH